MDERQAHRQQLHRQHQEHLPEARPFTATRPGDQAGRHRQFQRTGQRRRQTQGADASGAGGPVQWVLRKRSVGQRLGCGRAEPLPQWRPISGRQHDAAEDAAAGHQRLVPRHGNRRVLRQRAPVHGEPGQPLHWWHVHHRSGRSSRTGSENRAGRATTLRRNALGALARGVRGTASHAEVQVGLQGDGPTDRGRQLHRLPAGDRSRTVAAVGRHRQDQRLREEAPGRTRRNREDLRRLLLGRRR